MPQLDLTAGYTRNSNVPELTVLLPGEGSRTLFPNIPDNYRSRLGVSLPLYTGGRTAGSIEAAEREIEAATRDASTGGADLEQEVASAYWSLVSAQEDERTVGEAIGSYEAHLKESRDREQVGMAARNEVLAVQVERDRAELSRIEAAASVQAAQANLVRLLGLSEGSLVVPGEPLDRPEMGEEDLTSLLALARFARPERAAVAARAEAAEARARAQRAGYRPQVSFTAGYDYANPNRKILPPEARWEGTWDAGVGVTVTLFDGGRTAAAFAQASAQAEAARRQLEDLDRRIQLEVTTRLLDLRTAFAGYDVAERGVEAAEENRRVSRDRYHEGLIPSSELLDAEAALLRAGLDRTRALTRIRLAQANLRRATGG